MNSPLANPHRYRGYRHIPGSSGILAPGHVGQPSPIILPEDMDESLSGRFARNAQGICIPRGRSQVAYGSAFNFSFLQSSLGSYSNLTAANSSLDVSEDHLATTRFVTENRGLSAGEQDFMTRLADHLKGYFNARFQAMGQPTLEEAKHNRDDRAVRDVSYNGDKVMNAVRSMCRHLS